MKNKLIIAIVVLIILAITIYYLFFYVFTGTKTPLAIACNKIEPGVPESIVRNTMIGLENKNGVSFKKRDNNLFYTMPGFSGDFQCNITLDDNNKVKYVTKIFD